MAAAGKAAGHEKCGAKARSGKPCGRPAGWGTEHPGIGRCKFHGGSTPNHNKAAQVEILRREAERLGVPIDVDPGEALLDLVREAAGNVEFYRQLVAALPTHPTPDSLEVDGDGKPHYRQGQSGIYGRTYHQSGTPTGEAKPNVLVVMYDAERDRLADYVQAALKAGVEERRVRLAERDATMLFAAVGRALDRMGLSKRFEEFRVEFARALDEEPAALGTAGAR